MSSGNRSHSGVDPTTSVKRKVTVPVGRSDSFVYGPRSTHPALHAAVRPYSLLAELGVPAVVAPAGGRQPLLASGHRHYALRGGPS